MKPTRSPDSPRSACTRSCGRRAGCRTRRCLTALSLRGSRARPRYDIALPVELGAEIRLPAIPIIRPGPRLASAALLLGTLWVLFQIVHSPGLVAAEAAVLGNKMLTSAQGRSIGATDGMDSFLIDPGLVDDSLTAHAEISAAHVRVRWPNRVEIQVEEREPLVAWGDGGGGRGAVGGGGRALL